MAYSSLQHIVLYLLLIALIDSHDTSQFDEYTFPQSALKWLQSHKCIDSYLEGEEVLDKQAFLMEHSLCV